MSKYGHGSLNIRRAYPTDILRYTSFRVSWIKMADFSAFLQIDKLDKLYFVINVLSNETDILLNPAGTLWSTSAGQSCLRFLPVSPMKEVWRSEHLILLKNGVAERSVHLKNILTNLEQPNIINWKKMTNYYQLTPLESYSKTDQSAHDYRTFSTWLTTTFHLTHIMTSAKIVERSVTYTGNVQPLLFPLESLEKH